MLKKEEKISIKIPDVKTYLRDGEVMLWRRCRNCKVSGEIYFISTNGFCCKDCEKEYKEKKEQTRLEAPA